MEDLLERNKDRIICNWFLNPAAVKRDLKIRARLRQGEDWHVLKEFDFGTLAWDYEEGLKFETTIEQLPALVKWIKKFHKDHDIDFQCFEASLCVMGKDLPKRADEFKKAGLTQSKEHDFVFKLRPKVIV